MSYLARAQGTFINLPPAGAGRTFMMGSNAAAWSRCGDHMVRWGNPYIAIPVRRITLQPFAIQETPTTVAQFSAYIERGEQLDLRYGRFIYGSTGHVANVIWGSSAEAVSRSAVTLDAGHPFASISPIRQFIPTMDEYRSRFAYLEDGAELFLMPDHPVVKLTWYEAAAFAFSIGGRLPTEAEHEYAARAGREGDYIYGTDTGELTADNAHWKARATAPVKTYPANPWGLYDMTGNVSVWTQSWYADSLEALSEHDPVGPLDGERRVVRGGSCVSEQTITELLAAARMGKDPDRVRDYHGVRVVRPRASE